MSRLLLVVFFGLVCAANGAVVKLIIMSEQPLQPYDGWGGPCLNISRSDCTGGFAAVNAIMRQHEGSADLTIKVGSLESLGKLVLSHPLWISLNYKLFSWGHYDAIFLGHNVLTVTNRFSELVRTVETSPVPLIATNLDSSAYNLRAFLEYAHIADLPGGGRVAVMEVSPFEWGNSIHRDTLGMYIKTVREALNVTIVVVAMVDIAHDDDVKFLTQSGYVDVLLMTKEQVARESSTPSSVTREGRTWHLVASPLLSRVDVITLDTTATGLQGVSLSSIQAGPGMEPRYKDSRYWEEASALQHEIDVARAADRILGEVVAPMPHSFFSFDNGSEPIHRCLVGECHLGNFVLEAFMAGGLEEGDMAFLNGGNMFLGWDTGPVRQSDLSDSLPYQDNLCYVTMTAAGIWRALEYGVSALNAEGGVNMSLGYKAAGRFLQTVGMRYFYNPESPVGSRITRMEVPSPGGGWRAIDTQREYRVKMTNWMCTGGDGNTFAASSGEASISHLDQWSLAAEYLSDVSPYTPRLYGSIGIDKDGPPLLLAKRRDSCGEWGVFVPFFETCEPCPEGYYNPGKGCIVRPVPPPPPPSLVVTVGVPLVVVFVIVALLGVKVWWAQQQRRKAELVMYAPRGGEVAIVFTDIQSSTQLWGQYPEGMATALDIHHAIIREQIARHQGYEVKTIGDAFMVAFRDAGDAVRFSCSVQLELLRAEWPEELLDHPACKREGDYFNGLRVRIGVHIGEPVVKRTPQDGFDYEGSVVNQCSRVADSGNGGQILITEQVYHEVEADLVDVDVTYLGSFAFKGVNTPLSVLQVLPESLSNRSFKSLRNALPHFPETADTGNDTISEESVAVKKEEVEAMQVLRRYFSSHGPDGAPLHYVCNMLSKCVEAGHISDRRVFFLLCTVRPEAVEGQYSSRHSTSSTVVHNKRGSVSPNYLMKWSSFVAFARSLPSGCAAAMATFVDEGQAMANGGSHMW